MKNFLLVMLLSVALAGCSVKQMAVNLLGDALAGGAGVYASDDDPELVREAIPFGLKTYDSLLEVSPDHRGLLLAAAN
ncbi:MAG: TRAP transporter TatT component family protein, partial [Alphaproteobacteria bacterium]